MSDQLDIIMDEEQAAMVIVGMEDYSRQIDVQMLLNNRIPGILPLQIHYIDNESQYSYFIGSCITLEAALQKKPGDYVLIYGIYKGLVTALRHSREYFLGEDHFLLEPSMMYLDKKGKQLSLCYYPGFDRDFQEQLEMLNQYLLQRIDHKDKCCVNFIYGFYEMVSGKDFCQEEAEAYVRNYQKDTEDSDVNMLIDEKLDEKADSRIYKENKTAIRPEEFPFAYLDSVSRFCWRKLSQRVPIYESGLTIGRDPDNQLVLPSVEISRHHARLEVNESGIYLTDLNSTNGVYLNNHRLLVDQPVRCRHGDKLCFANMSYRLEICSREG